MQKGTGAKQDFVIEDIILERNSDSVELIRVIGEDQLVKLTEEQKSARG
jgi:hypothetical protein